VGVTPVTLTVNVRAGQDVATNPEMVPVTVTFDTSTTVTLVASTTLPSNSRPSTVTFAPTATAVHDGEKTVDADVRTY